MLKKIIIIKEMRECDTKRSSPLTLELLSPSRKAKNINSITRKKDERDLSLSQRQVISSFFPSNTYQSTQQSSLHIHFTGNSRSPFSQFHFNFLFFFFFVSATISLIFLVILVSNALAWPNPSCVWSLRKCRKSKERIFMSFLFVYVGKQGKSKTL